MRQKPLRSDDVCKGQHAHWGHRAEKSADLWGSWASSSRLRRGALGQVLARVEEANQLGRLLPPEAFYNELIRRVARAACAWRADSHMLPLRPLQRDC